MYKHWLILIMDAGSFSNEEVNDLIRESLKMKNFEHNFVLNLIGVCLDAGPAPYIVLPYMAKGSLLSYLKANRSSLLLTGKVEDDEVLLTCTLYTSPQLYLHILLVII